MSEINKKLKSVREAILKSDWTTDKFYQMPGKNGKYTDVNYVSLTKIKRNAMTVFLEYGIDYKIDMLSMENTDRGCRLTADVILTDLDSDEQDITHIIADAPASEKGASVALAYVTREYFSSRFGIIDGLNFEEEDDEDLTAILSAKAIEPVKDVRADAVSKPVEAKSPVTPTKDTPKADSRPNTAPFKAISPMEENGCIKTMQFIESVKDKIDAEVYEKAKAVFENRKSSADVLELMEIKRHIQSQQKPVQEGM